MFKNILPIGARVSERANGLRNAISDAMGIVSNGTRLLALISIIIFFPRSPVLFLSVSRFSLDWIIRHRLVPLTYTRIRWLSNSAQRNRYPPVYHFFPFFFFYPFFFLSPFTEQILISRCGTWTRYYNARDSLNRRQITRRQRDREKASRRRDRVDAEFLSRLYTGVFCINGELAPGQRHSRHETPSVTW